MSHSLDEFALNQRNEARAQYPLDEQGRRYCEQHGMVLDEEAWMCRGCREEASQRAARERAQRERIESVRYWWGRSTRPVDDDLGALPSWPWARFDNPTFTSKCDRQLLAAAQAYDLRSPLALFAKTGKGKTGLIVARLEQIRAQTLAAAEAGPFEMPPPFIYLAGYELNEANKRRRLGQDEHALIQAAQSRPLAILDEIHPSHTPVDVVFTILDMRTRRGLPTVIASGMSAAEFGAAFGAHAFRRVIQGGKVIDLFPKGK